MGASDNLAPGAKHLHGRNDGNRPHPAPEATRQTALSVILDEIGRGTSTYDGVAPAWAVVENLAGRAQGQLRTLLPPIIAKADSPGKLPGRSIFTMNIAIRESNGEILFLHKIIPGPADKSYGVEVARLAGVPYPVVQRARVILQNLEKGQGAAPGRVGVFNAASLLLPFSLEHFGSRKSADAKLGCTGQNPAVKKLLDPRTGKHQSRFEPGNSGRPQKKAPLQTAIDKSMISPFSAIQIIAENRIREAQQKREFDNLPGMGKNRLNLKMTAISPKICAWLTRS